MSGGVKWWGFTDSKGTIHVKAFFDDGDIREAKASPAVIQLFLPFEAESAKEAKETIENMIALKGGKPETEEEKKNGWR